jgi:hypothetical protein
MNKQENFMRYPLERRLGNVAVNFHRIAEHLNSDKALYFIKETKYLTDWCAQDCSLETQLELQAAQRTLARWSNRWATLEPSAAQAEARAIANRLLEMAGLI